MLGSGRKVRFAYRCAGADSGICQCLKQGRTIVRETDWLDPRPEHLRPWRVRKLYVGGARETEAWHVRVETGVYDPALG